MKKLLLISYIVLLILALTGCGGGGGKKGGNDGATPNPYAGTWQPEWSLAGAGQPDEGRLSLTIASNGTCSGEIYNSTLGVSIPVSGTCGNDGKLALTFQLNGKTYTITGTTSLTAGNLTIANFVYSVDGTNYNGACETSPPQQAEANAGTYEGTWSRDDFSGQITLNISADGKLTGTMTVDGQPAYGEAAITGMVDNAGKYVFTYKFSFTPDTLYRSKGTYTKTGNTITGSYTTEIIGQPGTTSGSFTVSLHSEANVIVIPECTDNWVSGIAYLETSVSKSAYVTISEVIFKIDNQVVGSATEYSINNDKFVYRYNWDSSDKVDGDYTFSVIAKTNQGDYEANKTIKVRHFLPSFFVYNDSQNSSTDSAQATLEKWDHDNNIPIIEADIRVNGVTLNPDSFGFYFPNSGAVSFNSGDSATFSATYPGMINVNESIEIPYPARNIQISDLDRWINGLDSDLTISWDGPLVSNFTEWWIRVKCYDTTKKYLGSSSKKVPIETRNYILSNSILKTGTVYAELYIESSSGRHIGDHNGINETISYIYDISALTRSEIKSNKP